MSFGKSEVFLRSWSRDRGAFPRCPIFTWNISTFYRTRLIFSDGEDERKYYVCVCLCVSRSTCDTSGIFTSLRVLFQSFSFLTARREKNNKKHKQLVDTFECPRYASTFRERVLFTSPDTTRRKHTLAPFRSTESFAPELVLNYGECRVCHTRAINPRQLSASVSLDFMKRDSITILISLFYTRDPRLKIL